MIFLPKKVAWLSSWSTRCGIAEMSKTLLSGDISTYFDLKVFASEANELDAERSIPVSRCWTNANDHEMVALRSELTSFSPDVIVIQYNFGFFDASALSELLKAPEFRNTRTILQLHAIKAPGENAPETLKTSGLFEVVDSVVVHHLSDFDALRSDCDPEKISIIPLPVHSITHDNRNEWRKRARQLLGVTSRTLVLSTYGFLLPNKGLKNAVQLLASLAERGVPAHLLMLNAMYPAEVSKLERNALIDEITFREVEDKITLVDDFLDSEDTLKMMSAADLGIFLYDKTNESSSAAIRTVLGGRLPVVTNGRGIFDDLSDIVLSFGESVEDIAQHLEYVFNSEDPNKALAEPKSQKDWLELHSDVNIKHRHFQLIRGLAERPKCKDLPAKT